MNNTNENNNLENEEIEMISNEVETQDTETSETTENTPIYYIPYYDNGCLCWRRNDGGGEEDDAALPITIGDNPVVTPIFAVTCENDLYDIADRIGIDNGRKEINIINYGSKFDFTGKDGGYQNHVTINHGDIYGVTTNNHIITHMYLYKADSLKENGGSLLSFFDNEIDDLNYYAVLNADTLNKLNKTAANVREYGATGDGETDDTTAFVDALKENRRVFVPGGTYKITGELVVRDNCELELSQDTVLEFVPDYFERIINDTTGEIISNVENKVDVLGLKDRPETFCCITLKMSSNLIGNHATIRVPYSFKGSVIYASTRSNDIVTGIEPFGSWDPQWKTARYLSDVNIVKPNSDGKHCSNDGFCNGTAVFVEGFRRNTNEGSTFIWGLDYSGLRIAGAFEYGIYGKNNYIMVDENDEPVEEYEDITGLEEKWAWTNDMKISGIIDGCEIGVYLYHCNYAYISTIIQPRAAENDTKYAIYGILLEESKYVDLTGSRVWDWDKEHTLGGPVLEEGNESASKIYQHIGLKGDCKGLLLDDFLYYRMDDYDIRDLIYTDNLGNFDKMTILQEPVTKYFKKSDEGKPFFHNGETSKELVLKDYFDEHFQTEKLYYYEDNILPNSKYEEDEELNEYGYVENMVISSDTGKADDSNYITTGYISCTPGTTLYFKGLDLCKDSSHYSNKIIYYYSSSEDIKDIDNSITNYYNQNNMVSSDYVNYISNGNSLSSITVPVNNKIANLKYIRICCHIDDVNEPIVSTKPITCTPRGYITDNVYVKEKYVEKQSTINTDSTDDQIPSAKAVYDLLESALGEYITDVANLVGGDV